MCPKINIIYTHRNILRYIQLKCTIINRGNYSLILIASREKIAVENIDGKHNQN